MNQYSRPLVVPTPDGCFVQLDSRRWLTARVPSDEARTDPGLLAELDRLGALPPLPRPLVVEGAGRLASLLLAGGALTIPDAEDPVAYAVEADADRVSVSDGPAPAHWDELDRRVRDRTVPWHRAWFEGRVGFCGPLFSEAGDPGHADTELRRRAADPQPAARAGLLDHLRSSPCDADPVAATLLASRLVTDLLQPDARSLARRTLAVLHPDRRATRHRVLPWPRGIQETPIP